MSKEFLVMLENMIYLLRNEFMDIRERLENYCENSECEEIKDIVSDVRQRLEFICEIMLEKDE